jgi:beta-lactam-binding protein with PASTA domain
MNNLIAFAKSKSFLKQIGIIVGAWIIFTTLVMFILGFYTHNGEKVEVPNFKGMTKAELEKFIETTDLRYAIIDSVFDLQAKKGAVADQVPKPGAFVKKDRLIYLTVNAILPPKVKMPNLVDLTLRQATARIETYGLKVGRLQYIPDLAKNAVLKQLLGVKEVKPGTLVNKGSSVNLVVGSGLGDEDIYVPNLIGLTKTEAEQTIEASSLSIGSVLWDNGIKDTATAKVYKQAPIYRPESRMGSGQSVDIFLTNDLSKVKADTLSTP